jgi:hypothetical protein
MLPPSPTNYHWQRTKKGDAFLRIHGTTSPKGKIVREFDGRFLWWAYRQSHPQTGRANSEDEAAKAIFANLGLRERVELK